MSMLCNVDYINMSLHWQERRYVWFVKEMIKYMIKNRVPGSAIGYHIHNGESETYYILSGTAKYNDNGVIKTVTAGDVTFTGSGEGHGIEAIGNEPVEMIALILYDKR